MIALVICGSMAKAGDKVLFIDSYHEGYPWSDGIAKGIKNVLGDKAELKIHHMDTKNNTGEDFMKKAAEKAKAVIDEWKPNVVIAADDNASKYLIKPFYADKDLPIVFCGLNWDCSVYGFPTKNICGMEEVSLVKPLLAQMKQFAKGEKIGFLTVDNTTGHKEAENYKKKFNLALTEKYAKSFDEWKKAFKELQTETDMVILENVVGIKDWDEKAAKEFVLNETKVPTGCVLDFVAPYVLVGYTKLAEEQGEWAAAAALKIIKGETPKEIGVVQNKRGQLYINLGIAKKLGVEIPMELIEQAKIIK